MRVLNKEEMEIEKPTLIERVLNGSIFIHPTDTIYGLGCDATNSEAVQKIREMKNRNKMPFSVIAPSKEWVMQNCIISARETKFLNDFPLSSTLILRLKKSEAVAKETNNGMDTLGVRLPRHWFSDFVNDLGVPIVTTSVNLTGEQFMTSVENLDPRIKSGVDFIIYEGEKMGTPSKIYDFSSEQAKVIER